MTFERFDISNELVAALNKNGISEPTKVQEKVIPLLLEGKDVLCMSETGSGKTISFSIPLIDNISHKNKVQALIVAPTRELAKQIAQEFRKFSRHKGIKTVTIYGGVSAGPQISRLETADVVVGTPGRLLDLYGQGFLKLSQVKYLVLDECDRMFDMGFIEDIEQIMDACNADQFLLFSATVAKGVREMANKHAPDHEFIKIKHQHVRGVLDQSYYVIAHNQKISLLVHLLKSGDLRNKLIIVFCRTKRLVDIVAGALKRQRIKADVLHGNLSQARRERVVKNFADHKVQVLVATDVAARGLHIDDIAYVINYNLTEDVDTYVHRVGRTARNGKEGSVINFLDQRDFRVFDDILHHYDNKIAKKELDDLKGLKIRKPRGGSGGPAGSGRSHGSRSNNQTPQFKKPRPASRERQYDRMALADLD